MKRFVEDYRDEQFDVVVIGGGITGAAVAYEAASRGLRVALLEKKDFGWATSAATSKLIHGGLRYLQNYEFGLVRESLKERRILENIAPNLVYPIPFLVPGYGDAKRSKWLLRAGLGLYDLLAYDKKRTWDKSKRIASHRWVSRRTVKQMEPQVRTQGLTGGSIYYDCQCLNPERLTLAFVKSAVKRGGKVANYAGVTGFRCSQARRLEAVFVEDRLNGRKLEVRGSLFVNCGGPWADIVLRLLRQDGPARSIKRSEGIHLLTRRPWTRQALVGWTPSGRHLFVIPWRGLQLIGTTDKEFVGDPDDYRVSRESIEELLRDTNDSLGDGSLTYGDVVFAYGGLRPLVDTATAGTYESSRRYEIYDHAAEGFEGLITVEGGKYTTSRHLAENVLGLVERKMGRKPGVSRTDREHLAGCEIKNLEVFWKDLRGAYGGFDGNTLAFVGGNYGTESEAVFEMARREARLAGKLTEEGQLLAAVVYAVREEMARTLSDILFRRTGLGNTGNPGSEVLRRAAEAAAGELHWDRTRVEEEIAAAEEALRLP